MAKKKTPEPIEENKPAVKPRTIIVSATEGEILTSRVKTTRELYMEMSDDQKS